MISVILPVYNCEKTIKYSLESVFHQTRYDLITEIIVINDGSTDNTYGVIKKIDNDKIIIINQINKGVSASRNVGIKLAKGKYIAFLDSDDYWFPEKIEKQMNIINKNKNIEFLGCDGAYSGVEKGKHYLPFKKYQTLYNMTITELCIKNYPGTPSIIMSKNLISNLGYFNEEMKFGEDINYFQKACFFYNNYYILPETLVYYGIQKTGFQSSGLSSNIKEMHKSNIINIKELKALGAIKVYFYIFLRFFYCIKYVRRLFKMKFL